MATLATPQPESPLPIEEVRPGVVLAERYRIDALVGEGGAGRVYAAEHILLRKKVAIKILRADRANVPEMVQRFEREAMAAAHIEHPNIASAIDFGRLADGSVFLALEFVAGRSLRKELRKGPLALGRALHIARQIASALTGAQALGIVHRDLKPENVMLIERGGDNDFVKVLDFGIARVPMADSAQPLTKAGAVFGTPAYMAPEQTLGLRVDGRADLYALGVMLFEMLTGSRPYREQKLGQQLTDPIPSLTSRGAHVAPEIEQLVASLLTRDVQQRFQRPDALVAALDSWLSTNTGSAAFKSVANGAREAARAPAKAATFMPGDPLPAYDLTTQFPDAAVPRPSVPVSSGVPQAHVPPASVPPIVKGASSEAPKGPPPPPRRTAATGAPPPPSRAALSGTTPAPPGDVKEPAAPAIPPPVEVAASAVSLAPKAPPPPPSAALPSPSAALPPPSAAAPSPSAAFPSPGATPSAAFPSPNAASSPAPSASAFSRQAPQKGAPQSFKEVLRLNGERLRDELPKLLRRNRALFSESAAFVDARREKLPPAIRKRLAGVRSTTLVTLFLGLSGTLVLVAVLALVLRPSATTQASRLAVTRSSALPSAEPVAAPAESAPASVEAPAAPSLAPSPAARAADEESLLLELANTYTTERRDSEAVALVQRVLLRRPELKSDARVSKILTRTARSDERAASEQSFALLEGTLGEAGAEAIYDLWRDRESSERVRRRAESFLRSSNFDRASSTGLYSAVKLRLARTCDQKHALLRLAGDVGQRRTLEYLRELEQRTTCTAGQTECYPCLGADSLLKQTIDRVVERVGQQ